MISVVCDHCRLPLRVARVTPGRAVYCCSGCALAARVPVNAQGEFPVNGAVVTALGVGFAAFNQLLFWLLAILLLREGKAQMADRWVLGSLILGAVVWASLAWLQLAVGARRVVDMLVLAVGGAALAVGALVSQPCLVLAGNLGVIAWSLRGVRRRGRG
jgi:hypothetical protein